MEQVLRDLYDFVLQVNLDVMLSGLESADHSNRPELLPLRRPFLLTGSCLIYRGALACSHLSPPDQRAVATYCYAYRLLELTATESVSQIVIWKEVCKVLVLKSWSLFCSLLCRFTRCQPRELRVRAGEPSC